MASMLSPQFIRFLLAGGIAAAANYGSRFLFGIWLDYGVSIVLAYLVGMTVAFILMRQHVFTSARGPVSAQVAKFVLVNLLAVGQTLLISLLLARWVLPALGVVAHAEAIGHLVGVLVPVVTSYFGHRMLTFK
ncbi:MULTISPECIES: GtrA family protein [unclassified Variovorax]|uniref:GtrA family protein n=1 Tax=unclassified Variovorax TaxID=663243 RepID=UPI0025775F80|nr:MULTISPECIES: GtrA family protein [unclassified Variovorax]MDM0090039.1 GtrA family protein [Variovorax sp. J22G40]MDM0148295.1 GtrA family protein [Variovorax sp. J2P1-31]